MRTDPHRLVRCYLFIVVGLFIVAGLYGLVSAAPPGPGPKPAQRNTAKPAKRPANRPPAVTPKPGPKPQAVKPPGGKPPKPISGRVPYRAPKYRNINRHPRYYHPYYHRRQNLSTYYWTTLGYSYYVGGTSYTLASNTENIPPDRGDAPRPDVTVIMPPAAENEESQPSTEDDNSAAAYMEIQELTDLIHEWRTLNESASFHERVAAASRSEEHKATLADIRQGNQDFDRASRLAMQKLAGGEDADTDLDNVRSCLENLIQLAESLPETETSSADQNTK